MLIFENFRAMLILEQALIIARVRYYEKFIKFFVDVEKYIDFLVIYFSAAPTKISVLDKFRKDF